MAAVDTVKEIVESGAVVVLAGGAFAVVAVAVEFFVGLI